MSQSPRAARRARGTSSIPQQQPPLSALQPKSTPEEDPQVFSWLLLWNYVIVWHQLCSTAAAATVSASA
jgi:hypothetical protein